MIFGELGGILLNAYKSSCLPAKLVVWAYGIDIGAPVPTGSSRTSVSAAYSTQ